LANSTLCAGLTPLSQSPSSRYVFLEFHLPPLANSPRPSLVSSSALTTHASFQKSSPLRGTHSRCAALLLGPGAFPLKSADMSEDKCNPSGPSVLLRLSPFFQPSFFSCLLLSVFSKVLITPGPGGGIVGVPSIPPPPPAFLTWHNSLIPF